MTNKPIYHGCYPRRTITLQKLAWIMVGSMGLGSILTTGFAIWFMQYSLVLPD